VTRPLRVDAPGEFFHVLARGNDRRPIFEDDKDRAYFLDLVTEVVERFHVRCHGYCLMRNHYHLLLQPMLGGLPRAIRHLNGRYAQRLNWRHDRSGHVFEGRYKSILVDTQPYFMELARYIVLNPVRAGMVATPEQWPWSSYSATAGLAQPPAFLAVDELRRAAGGREGAEGALDFQTLVAIGDPDGGARVEKLMASSAAGDRGFLERVGERAKAQRAQREIPVEQRMVGRPPLAELLGGPTGRANRDARIRRAVLEYGYTQAAIAEQLGLGRATISRAMQPRANSNQEALFGARDAMGDLTP
jgi:REP element-mobilizing transposase RayT